MDRKPEIDFENDRLLDKLLKDEPDYFLSDDFADNLVKKIRIRQSVKQNMMEYLTILGAVVGILVAFGGTYYFLNRETFMVIKSFVFNGYTPIAVVIVLFVFFMDKVMLRLLNQLKM
jgi:hypothetical protein